MDHSHSHGHGDMDMGSQCKMNMVFTWSNDGLCIIFESWRPESTLTLILSLLGVILLTAGYEAVRELSRRYERRLERKVRVAENPNEEIIDNESSSLLYPGRAAAELEHNGKVVKAGLYAVQVFYSFFIMLLFMTYNGWVMIAVAMGAFVGFLAFGQEATKTVACH